jgi:hypothetical protein
MIKKTSVDFIKVAKDDLGNYQGDEGIAEYVAGLLEWLYDVDPAFRKDLNVQWDRIKDKEKEGVLNDGRSNEKHG